MCLSNRDGDNYIEMAFDVRKGNGTSQARAIVEVVILLLVQCSWW